MSVIFVNPDYPAPEEVLDGVSYGGGVFTGTFTIVTPARPSGEAATVTSPTGHVSSVEKPTGGLSG